MVFKVRFMWVRDVCLTEQHYMVMNPQLSLRRREKKGFSLHVLEVHERKAQNKVKSAQIKRNPASMWILLCQYLIWNISKKSLKVSFY